MENQINAPKTDEKDSRLLNIQSAIQKLKNEPLKCSNSNLLSKYSSEPPATNEQIKNFIKTLIALFPNNNELFWTIISQNLIEQKPSYRKIYDMYQFFLKEFPYRTLTAKDILGFNENIETFDAITLSNEMEKNPTTFFASIKISETKHVYCTLDDAKKTSAEYNIIPPLSPHSL